MSLCEKVSAKNNFFIGSHMLCTWKSYTRVVCLWCLFLLMLLLCHSQDPLEVDDHIDITGFSLVLELSYPFDDSRVFMDDDDTEVTLFSSILMQETATKIESFPFKNNSLETIHNVVISSSLAKNVESARLSIRVSIILYNL